MRTRVLGAKPDLEFVVGLHPHSPSRPLPLCGEFRLFGHWEFFSVVSERSSDAMKSFCVHLAKHKVSYNDQIQYLRRERVSSEVLVKVSNYSFRNPREMIQPYR